MMAAPDNAASIAHDLAAPAGERFDAQAELGKAHRVLRSNLLPSDAVHEVIEYAREGLIAEAQAMAKGGNVIQFADRQTPPPKRGMQSVYLDKLQIYAYGDYYEKPSPLGFDSLREMVEKTPILNSVVMTRIRQITRFCQPSEDNGPGFTIRHMDRDKKLAGADKDAAMLLTKFFQNCGFEFNPRRRKALKRDNFTSFMKKLVRDTLTFDACPIETEMKRNRALGIDGLYAIDGATVRLCTEEGYLGNDEITALQVNQGRIVTAYTLDSLIYEVRNPRTDVRLAGYGLGETELLIRVVTGFLNAMAYNIAGFDNNAIPKGLLHLSGQYSDSDLAAFKRYWNATVKGVNNAWTLPVMVSSDQQSKASFETFGQEFNEMHFSKWMTFLVSIVCSIYGMSPDEINFESFSSQKSALAGSDTEEKLANSKDLGLLPDMAFFESMFTDFVVAEFDDNLCFRWVGLQEEDQDKLFEKQRLVLRVDELRSELGYEPDPDFGDAPLNPSFVGAWQASKQPPQGGDFGAGGQGQDFGQAPPDDADGGGDGGAAPDDAPPKDQGRATRAPASAPSPAEVAGAGAAGGDFGGGGAAGDFGKALAASVIYTMGD